MRLKHWHIKPRTPQFTLSGVCVCVRTVRTVCLPQPTRSIAIVYSIYIYIYI